jgi:hypothetical protein
MKRRQGVSSQEAVMSEADLFRRYAKEAIYVSTKATIENEKRSLIDLICDRLQPLAAFGHFLEG